MLLKILGKDESQIEFVKDRPGHDRRYAIDSTKIETELGFKHEFDFESGLQQTIEWYQNNTDWWQRCKSGAYQDYYKEQYSK